MSTTAEAGGAVASPVEGDDSFGDDSRLDKKKKFKPFQKMKNFFRGSSKKRFKPEESAGQKSHSTGALHQSTDGQDDDDDDGGFRQKGHGLAGSRSISEDSIFKPDTKESKPGVLENKTVSMENIDANPFQSELFAKLRSRQSDSDIDEGLPYSPLTTLTPHGLMFNTSQKSVPAAGKSTSLESERSLISVDGSDEDLFTSDWKAGVASVKKPRSSSLDGLGETNMNVCDFEAVEMRSTLSNDAAKHRIAVKPKSRRLSAKMSVKRRDKSPAPQTLPEVKEESPTKVHADSEIGEKQTTPHKTIISTTIAVGHQSDQAVITIPRSEPRDIPGHAEVSMRSQVKDMARSEPREIPHASREGGDVERSRPRSMSPLSTSPVSQSMLQEVKLRKRPVSGKFDDVEVKKEADEPSDELAKAFNRAKRISKKFDEEGNMDLSGGKPSVKEVEKEMELKPHHEVEKLHVSIPSPKEENKPITVTSPVKDSPLSPQVSSPVSGVSFVLKKEPLRPTSKTANTDAKQTIPKTVTIAETQPVIESPASVTVSTILKEEMKTEDKASSNTNSPIKIVKQGSPEKLASPREDYKLKRAARSKTLPASKDSLDKTEDIENKFTIVRHGSPPLRDTGRSDYDNVVIDGKSSITQSKRASWASPSVTTESAPEPPWVVRQRLKQMELDQKDEKEKEDSKDKTDSAKEVKVEVKGVTALKDENPYVNFEPKTEVVIPVNKAPSPTEQKLDIAKGTVQANSVKSWAQTYSAKPFEKPAVKSSIGTAGVKPSLEKPTGVHSVKAPDTTNTPNTKAEQDNAGKVSSINKPAVPASSKPTAASTSKPPLSGLVKPAVPASSKPADTGSNNANKPFSQSLNSKSSGFGGVSSASAGFSRSFVQKTNTGSVQKSGQEVKLATQTSVKPTNVSKTDSVNVSSNTSTSNQDNKKTDNDLKNAQTAASTQKTGSSTDKSKASITPAVKQDTSPAVPAWKQALSQKKAPTSSQPVKIEIIDKDENKSPKKKVEEKPVQMREKTTPEKYSNIASNRPSKVLDMVKSFQKLQVT